MKNFSLAKATEMAKKMVAQILLVLIIIIFAILKPDTFFTLSNIMTIVRQVATMGIVALGVSFLMLTGNLDFSVGKIYAFAGVVAALLYQAGINIWLASLIAVGCCILASVITGVISMKFDIPMLIVSIAMMQVIDGVNMILTDGSTIYGLPEEIKFLGQGYIFGIIPVAVVIFALLALIVAFILNKTYLGRYFFAVGGNNTTARLSGINVNRVKLIASIFCGILTGIAGIIMMSRSFSGSPYSGTSMGNDVISAAVLGGVSIQGGVGKTSGVVTGVLIIGVLSQGLVMVGMSSNIQNMIKGAILILAVIMDKKSKVVAVKKEA